MKSMAWAGTVLVCCMYWTGVLYGVLHVLDWCVVCTGLVCCMYWTGVLYVLDWCVVCTGLVCWTGVLYVLDWCVACTPCSPSTAVSLEPRLGLSK